jgi:hypothetical protein
VLQVLELVALDGDALRETWAYLLGHDLIKTIRARVGPPDHPLLLLVSEPRRLGLRIADGVWLPIVDVAAALAARRYVGSGSLVLEVSNGFMPEWAGRWRLAVEAGAARVEPTTDPTDLALDVTDLGAVVSHVQPWCAQIFQDVAPEKERPKEPPGPVTVSAGKPAGAIPVPWPLRDERRIGKRRPAGQPALSTNCGAPGGVIHGRSRSAVHKRALGRCPIICRR